ncbi:cyclic nucleotide-gated ion channel [Roseibium aestuarii]|uniref:Cyclic nucleotide-gated ion channel n=1 Tax=Roseibium aestuarii TaxID=2600299 RepID=A0ABW4JX05_9HYPH|nr:cyclic nucleotide-gated ion channel [Roseibium aestuarii]
MGTELVGTMGGVKKTLYSILENTGRHRRLARIVSRSLVGLIILNVVLAVLETEQSLDVHIGSIADWVQTLSGFVFLTEYLARLYVADLHPPLRRYGPLGSRWRYALQADAIIDLAAALPLLLVLVLPNTAVTLVVLLRLSRFLKLARYSPALRSLFSAIASERHALVGSSVIIFGVILTAATLMYLLEHEAQPEAFASIPSALWWAISTVTTVGYGDVVPRTDLGRVVGGVVMLVSYGLLALPVGIIASAFSREIHSRDFVVTWSMVARVPLFEDLRAADIAEVSKLLRAQRVRAGDVIASKGTVADAMYFISDGEVAIELPHETIYLGEGNYFGELALLKRRARTATITAFHDCELMVLEAQALANLMDRKPKLAARILAEAEERHMATMRASGDLAPEELAQAEAREEEEPAEEGAGADAEPDLLDPGKS